jgi:hypothetical protein
LEHPFLTAGKVMMIATGDNTRSAVGVTAAPRVHRGDIRLVGRVWVVPFGNLLLEPSNFTDDGRLVIGIVVIFIVP